MGLMIVVSRYKGKLLQVSSQYDKHRKRERLVLQATNQSKKQHMVQFELRPGGGIEGTSKTVQIKHPV
jgi:hypothetical protein